MIPMHSIWIFTSAELQLSACMLVSLSGFFYCFVIGPCPSSQHQGSSAELVTQSACRSGGPACKWRCSSMSHVIVTPFTPPAPLREPSCRRPREVEGGHKNSTLSLQQSSYSTRRRMRDSLAAISVNAHALTIARVLCGYPAAGRSGPLLHRPP